MVDREDTARLRRVQRKRIERAQQEHRTETALKSLKWTLARA